MPLGDGPTISVADKTAFDDKAMEVYALLVSFTHASALALGATLCAIVNRWLARESSTPVTETVRRTLRNTLQDLVVLTFLMVAVGWGSPRQTNIQIYIYICVYNIRL